MEYDKIFIKVSRWLLEYELTSEIKLGLIFALVRARLLNYGLRPIHVYTYEGNITGAPGIRLDTHVKDCVYCRLIPLIWLYERVPLNATKVLEIIEEVLNEYTKESTG